MCASSFRVSFVCAVVAGFQMPHHALTCSRVGVIIFESTTPVPVVESTTPVPVVEDVADIPKPEEEVVPDEPSTPMSSAVAVAVDDAKPADSKMDGSTAIAAYVLAASAVVFAIGNFGPK
ncbi:hypothetical protein CTAYLR_000011 [Chrysophaeum taylorii]|uniref:Transmembrane protein n=1 Tax=Chrysophaeum taylorii TaxID=2483200 RepID=A0AAD7UIP4_9STRA|nr:hypothetical protein CTAYLR_000011 [Chrysophaeum taylorii]